jgi:hypothetical protein
LKTRFYPFAINIGAPASVKKFGFAQEQKQIADENRKRTQESRNAIHTGLTHYSSKPNSASSSYVISAQKYFDGPQPAMLQSLF